MIYLDTHIVVWLYAGLIEKFSDPVRSLLNEHDIYVSPIVQLELGYLLEIGRINAHSERVLIDLAQSVGLTVCDKDFRAVVQQATSLSWTRDPFDRLVVAQAALRDNLLVTKDSNILAHYPLARW